MITVVLDTNVLASGFTTHDSPPAQLLQRWPANDFRLVLSEHLLTELGNTLAKPYFRQRYMPEQVQRAIDLLRRRARAIVPTAVVPNVASHPSHPEDDLILAIATQVQPAYLVTGDKALQALQRYQEVTILSPRAFLDLLPPASPA